MTPFLSHGSLIKAAQIVTFFIALGFVGPVYAQDCKLKSKLEILNLVKTSHPQLALKQNEFCLLYTSPSPRDQRGSRMPSSA